MTFTEAGDQVHFTSQRTTLTAQYATFSGSYGPTGPVAYSTPGSLEYWLTERYRLYSADGRGRQHRPDIYHDPWPLQPAAATIAANTMTLARGIPLPDTAPLCHYARRMPAIFWLPGRVAAVQQPALQPASRALIPG
jgi:uncharacterized protein YqjF (DUF2071 family)